MLHAESLVGGHHRRVAIALVGHCWQVRSRVVCPLAGDERTQLGPGDARPSGPILKALKPELVGRDPAELEWPWSRLGILAGRRGLSMNAWPPVEVALWDNDTIVFDPMHAANARKT